MWEAACFDMRNNPRHGASCPFTARLRPPCAQGLGRMEVSTFLTCLLHRYVVFKVRPVE